MKKAFPNKVWLNGHWKSSKEATVSAFDRGFLLGDGIYDVIPYFHGEPFQLEAHMQRLQSGLDAIGLSCNIQSLPEIFKQAIDKEALSDVTSGVYVQITRGVAPRAHHYPEQYEPTLLVYAFPVHLPDRNNMAAIWLAEDERWHRCDIKSISLMANVKANNEAYTRGAYETVLIRDGKLTEGSHSSAFFVRDDTVITHPKNQFILPGITRQVVIDICKEKDISIREEALPVEELSTVDEAFLTGTTTQVLAVGTIQHKGGTWQIGKQPGPVTAEIQQAYYQQIKQL